MAAVDLDIYQPFDAGAGADVVEDGWRAMARNWLTSGPIRLELNSFLVTTDSGRNVLLSSGRCWINGHYGQLTSDTTVAVATNTSGNSRIDRVVLRADFVNNKIVYDILQGTPAGSPVAPTLTQNTSIWEISLAKLSLANSYSTISAGNITDERRWASGRPPGGPFVIACATVRTTSLTCTDGTWTALPFSDSEEYDTASIHSTSSNTANFVVPGGCAGVWHYTILTTWDAAASGARGIRVNKNGSLLRTGPHVVTVGVFLATPLAWTFELALVPGDTISWEVLQVSGGNLNLILARATARFVGSLVA